MTGAEGCEGVLALRHSIGWSRERASQVPLFTALRSRHMHTQPALLLLRSCGLPRLNFLTRTLPPSILRACTTTFDEQVARAFEEVAGLALPVGSVSIQLTLRYI